MLRHRGGICQSPGEQQGAARGYNPNKRERLSHHPLLAFVAEARMVANFWLRPGDTNSANNVLQFIESTLHHLGSKTVGLLLADSGFFDQAVFKLLESKHINYIISARLTQGLQQAIIRDASWFGLGYIPVVPPKANRLAPWEYNRAMYKKRNEIERLFRRLKGFRRIFSRFDKLDVVFLAFINFALIVEVLHLREPGNFSQLCERCGISRKTGYKWVERYQAEGIEGLEERSRRPHVMAGEIPYALRKAITDLRRQGNVPLGPKKIQALLSCPFPISPFHRRPASTTC